MQQVAAATLSLVWAPVTTLSPPRNPPPLHPPPARSGHDLQDTHDLLAQTEGTGVNVWTHGELLPAHGYPAIRKRFPHLVSWASGQVAPAGALCLGCL